MQTMNIHFQYKSQISSKFSSYKIAENWFDRNIMGSVCSARKPSDSKKLEHLIDLIDRNSVQSLQPVVNQILKGEYGSLSLSTVLDVHSIKLTCAGYALYAGSERSFKLLFEASDFDVATLNEQFAALGKSPVDIICELGYEAMLRYYLPYHLIGQSKVARVKSSEELSVFDFVPGQTSLQSAHSSQPVSPIHTACEHGHLAVVKFLHEYFTEPPPDYSVHFVDEATGMNAALAACKSGSLELLRYLHEICKADFLLLNKRNETAVQIAAAWAKKRKVVKLGRCIRYLVEAVGVDLSYNHEELLLVLDDSQVTRYVEDHLREKGIEVNKKDIEKKCEFKRLRKKNTADKNFEKKVVGIKGAHFEFKKLFTEDFANNNEVCSPISSQESQNFSNIAEFPVLDSNDMKDNQEL